ncbi:hypothetical protein NKG05_07830 [Oerskovia sp. M15]
MTGFENARVALTSVEPLRRSPTTGSPSAPTSRRRPRPSRRRTSTHRRPSSARSTTRARTSTPTR